MTATEQAMDKCGWALDVLHLAHIPGQHDLYCGKQGHYRTIYRDTPEEALRDVIQMKEGPQE